MLFWLYSLHLPTWSWGILAIGVIAILIGVLRLLGYLANIFLKACAILLALAVLFYVLHTLQIF